MKVRIESSACWVVGHVHRFDRCCCVSGSSDSRIHSTDQPIPAHERVTIASISPMKLSVFCAEVTKPESVTTFIVQAEELGFYGVWLPQIMGLDSLTMLAVAGDVTSTIKLGTSVVPTYPRHPSVMAQQAATVSLLTDGRFRLGIGTSHVPVIEGMLGLKFDRPISHMREYVTVVKGLLNDGHASMDGDHYQVQTVSLVKPPPTPVMMSVLSQQMCRVAGSVADGGITWVAPPEHIAATVVPEMSIGAKSAGRDRPPVVAEVPCAIDTDQEAVRVAVNKNFSIYPTLPFYNTMMRQASIPGSEEALRTGVWSPQMVDAIIPHGDEAAVAKKIQQFFDAGADEVVLAPFPVGDDAKASIDRTLRGLSSIAAG